MVNSGILVMLHITLSDVICDRMMLNLSAIVMLTAGVLSSASSTPPRNLWSASTSWCRYRVPLCSWSLSRSGHWQREVRADDQQQWWRPRDGYGAVRGSDRGQPLAQLQLPQKRLKSSIVGAWQSVQKALRNEIQIEIWKPKLKVKSYQKQSNMTGLPTLFQPLPAKPPHAVLEEDQVEEIFRGGR